MYGDWQYTYGATFIWGWILLASWIGTGSLIARAVWRGAYAPDWGLRAGWGIAAHLAVAGVLCLTHLATRDVIFALVVATAAYQFAEWGHELAGRGVARLRGHALAHGRIFFVAAVALPLVLTYASMVTRKSIAWTDADDYARAQRAVPPGEKVLAAVDYPFVLDYGRNDVKVVDGAGMCSPPPGIPIWQGWAAVRDYLVGRQGIRYVVTVDFSGGEQGLLSRRAWELTAEGRGTYVPAHAPYFLAFMDAMDAMARSEDVVFREGNLRVARLRPGRDGGS